MTNLVAEDRQDENKVSVTEMTTALYRPHAATTTCPDKIGDKFLLQDTTD